MPEPAIVVIKSLLFFLAVILLVRLWGRRWAAQRTGWDRIFGVVIAFLAAGMSVDLVPLLEGMLALITWAVLGIAVNFLMFKSKKVRDFLEGREIVVIQHGKVLEENLKEARLTPEDFLRQLRSKNVFQLDDVEFAVMESDGEVNVLLKRDSRPLTPTDFGRSSPAESAPQTVILDGNILDEGLTQLGLNRAWLKNELDKLGVSLENVMIGQVNPYGDLFVDLFDDAVQVQPPSNRQLLDAQLQAAEADFSRYELETQDEAARRIYRQCLNEIRTIRKELSPYLQP